MKTTDNNNLLNQLDEAMLLREKTLEAARKARAEDQDAWDRVQAIAKQMGLSKGRTVAGRWIISKGMDHTGMGDNIEVTRAQIFGQNVNVEARGS